MISSLTTKSLKPAHLVIIYATLLPISGSSHPYRSIEVYGLLRFDPTNRMSSESMSVNSLIQRQHNKCHLDDKSEHHRPRDSPEIPPANDSKNKSIPSTSSSTNATEDKPMKSLLDKNAITSLLGDDLHDSPYSEAAILELVKLKIEQERTKQQQIKLDIATKNYNIMTTALNAKISSHLIPQMCVNPNDDQSIQTGSQITNVGGNMTGPHSSTPHSSAASPFPPPPPSIGLQQSQTHPLWTPVQTSGSHSRSNSQDFGAIPLNYRFGGGSTTSTSNPNTSSHLHPSSAGSSGSTGSTSTGPPQFMRRPLSPAKLGAQAVANLNHSSSSSSYRFPPGPQRTPLIPQHQRHFSMPADTNARLKNPSIDLTKIDNYSYQQNLPFQQTSHPTSQPQAYPIASQTQPSNQHLTRLPQRQMSSGGSGGQTTPAHSRSRSTASISSNKGSPLGSSTMQVKPAPAQPLQKSNRLLLPPSQESMTSFQHVIQFQQWKPESTTSPEARSHKRHKSNADNMSVDLGNPMTGNVRGEIKEETNEEADISMESTADNKEDKRGNYPNILHS